ncbi:MAG: phosphotransferase [Desulfatibacillum sp.]|nr:phosphotransferase [Desulfatibacillum sp.]
MKALILAAGFGVRLMPLTEKTPKPLFPVGGIPVLLRMIRSLETTGCTEIAINTHHLAPRIQEFIDSQKFSIPVNCFHEPEILGTGGAIKNLEDMFWEAPFMVVNADVVTDLNFAKLIKIHKEHGHAATLVVHDCPPYNNVLVRDDAVVRFASEPGPDMLAFTGIQIIDPIIFDFLKKDCFQSSITAYEEMMAARLRITAWEPNHIWWHDIGSFQGLSRACLETGAMQLFAKALGLAHARSLRVTHLAGGGSSRQWFRLSLEDHSMVAVDHGLAQDDSWTEADAYNAIGKHLHTSGVPVPEILGYDRFSGLVYVQDLGDACLEQVVKTKGYEQALPLYEKTIKSIAKMASIAAKGFDTTWTYQTPSYDEELILEKESRYFFEACVNRYLNQPAKFEDYLPELRVLARNTVEGAIPGFLHRDFQSRNIMVYQGQCFFIDFQGARMGPVQYDLASLLIDPYTALPSAMQDLLLELYMDEFSQYRQVERNAFLRRYQYCALHRNMQMLGAFAHLSKNMNKPGFEEFISPALAGLKERIRHFPEAPGLAALVESLPLPQ